jgi:predicted metal-dependent enzyme (double-stranded beta helix superfamily)
MTAPRPAVFQRFIDGVRTIWSEDPDMGRRMERAKPLLERLVMDPGMHARSKTWPSTEGRKNLLLYVDDEHGFAINAVVRVPGRTGSVHDHANAWVLYGVIDGTESLERWHRVDDGSKPGYARVELTSVTTGSQGKVDIVPPHDIHAEQGGPTRSAAIILRSMRLGEGTVLQKQYDAVTGEVTERFGPTQIPYALEA